MCVKASVGSIKTAHVCNDFYVQRREQDEEWHGDELLYRSKMQIQKFYGQSPYGKLYLVATLIGNSDDMSFVLSRPWKEVDWIAKLRTHAHRPAKHFDIPPSRSVFTSTMPRKRLNLISFLKAGQSIAQVSDAGLAQVSQTLGMIWSRQPLEEEIAVVTVPGASAGIFGRLPVA